MHPIRSTRGSIRRYFRVDSCSRRVRSRYTEVPNAKVCYEDWLTVPKDSGSRVLKSTMKIGLLSRSA